MPPNAAAQARPPECERRDLAECLRGSRRLQPFCSAFSNTEESIESKPRPLHSHRDVARAPHRFHQCEPVYGLSHQRSRETKSDVIVLAIVRKRQSSRCVATSRVTAPPTASRDTDTIGSFVDPRGAIVRRAVVVAVVTVCSPFPDVAMHVVEAESVRALFTGGVRVVAGVRDEPRVFTASRGSVSEGEYGTCASASCILPFGF
jgi:hypothetical protein